MTADDELTFLRRVVSEVVWCSERDRLAGGCDYRYLGGLTDDELAVLKGLIPE